MNLKSLNSSNHRLKGSLFLLPILLILGSSLVVGSKLGSNGYKKVYKVQDQSVKEVLGVSVNNKVVELKVNSKTKKGPRVTLNISIKNNTPEVLQFSPGLSLRAIDDLGASHLVTMKFVSPDLVIGGPIGSGKSTTLDVDFEVENSSDLVKLIYQPGQASEKLEIKL